MAQPAGKMQFYCPCCNQKLSFLDGTMIKLVGRLHAATFSCKTMFYIPATLGRYGAIVGEGAQVKEGAVVEFECINGGCKRNFTSEYDEDLAEIKMVDGSGQEFIVVFNKTFGRRSTFLVDFRGKQLIGSYGEHADEDAPDFGKSINFFGD